MPAARARAAGPLRAARALLLGTIFLLPAAAAGQQEDLRLAEGLFERGLYDLAVEAYNKVLQDYPHSQQVPLATFRLAEAYRLSNNQPMALRLYRLLDAPPRDAAVPPGPYADLARLRLGENHLMRGEFASACRTLRKITPASLPAASRPAFALYLGRSAYEAGEFPTAREAFESLLATPDAPRYSLLQGRFFLGVLDQADGQAEQALTRFRALAEEPDLGEPYREQVYSRTARLLYNLERHDEAAAAARAFCQMYPDSREVAEIQKAGIWADIRTNNPRRVIDELAGREGSLDDPELVYCLASAYRMTDQDASALALYDRLSTPGTPGPIREKAAYEAVLISARSGTARELIRRANAFGREFPNSRQLPEVYLLAARTYRATGQLDIAHQTFEAILRLPGAPTAVAEQAAYQVAECLKERQQFAAAAAAFGSFARDYPTSPLVPRARLAEATCLLAGGRAADAEALLDQHRSLLEGIPEIAVELAYQRALARAAAGDRPGMARRLEELLEQAPDAPRAGEASYLLGLYHFENEELGPAIDRLSAALRHPLPASIARQTRMRLAMAWQQKGDPDQAVRLFLETLRQGGAAEVPDQLLLWIGHRCLERLQFEEAVAAFSPLLERATEPDMTQAAALGLAYAEIGLSQHDLARGHLVQAVGIEPRNQPGIEGNLALGDLYLRAGGQIEAARACYRSALEAGASEWPLLAAKARLGLARAAQAARDPAEAARQFLAVAVLYDDPQLTPQALLDAGKAFLDAGDENHAREAFDELRRRFPESPPARSLSAAQPERDVPAP